MSFFNWKDFDTTEMFSPDEMASRANNILEERGVRVYGYKTTDENICRFYQDTQYQMLDCDPQKQALLINIEEIQKKECTHEKVLIPYNSKFLEAMKAIVCADCHKSLRPEWKSND